MKCPACKFENDLGDLFCGGCGTDLKSICRKCVAEIKPGRKFCTNCGATTNAAAYNDSDQGVDVGYTPKHLTDKILKARSALEGERKQVSILFVDIKGSMQLASKFDSET